MNVDKAAGNSRSLQRPDVLVPALAGKHTVFAVLLWWPQPLKTCTGARQAQSKSTLWLVHAFRTVTMKQARVMLLNKMR